MLCVYTSYRAPVGGFNEVNEKGSFTTLALRSMTYFAGFVPHSKSRLYSAGQLLRACRGHTTT